MEASDDRSGSRRLSRNVRVLSLVSFFQDTASEMLYPILPLFLTTVLGAPPAVIGLIEGVAEGTASVMKVVSGRLADLRRRRPLVATGYSISGVAKVLIGFATAWPLVLVARFGDRVGKGLRGPPRDAIIGDETTPANRGRAFGFHRAADTGGAVVGPLLGLGLYELVGQEFRPLFFLAAIPATISVALIFLVRERAHPRPPVRSRHIHDGRRRSAIARLGDGRLPRPFWRVVALLGVFSLVNFSDALLLLRAKELGFGVSGVVFAYVLYNLTYAAISYPAGVWSDRVSRRAVYGAGLGVFAVAYVGLGLIDSGGWIWLLLPLYGCYTGLTDGVSRAWVVDLVPADERGTALGVHAGLTGVGALVAGIWAGLAWNAGGGNGTVPLVVAGGATAAVAVAVLAGRRWLEGEPRPAPSG